MLCRGIMKCIYKCVTMWKIFRNSAVIYRTTFVVKNLEEKGGGDLNFVPPH